MSLDETVSLQLTQLNGSHLATAAVTRLLFPVPQTQAVLTASDLDLTELGSCLALAALLPQQRVEVVWSNRVAGKGERPFQPGKTQSYPVKGPYKPPDQVNLAVASHNTVWKSVAQAAPPEGL